MLSRRCSHGVAVLDGVVFAAGGYDGNSHLATAECYNMELDEWRMVAPMSFVRCWAGLASIGLELYAFGGYDSSLALQDKTSGEKYNPIVSTWTTATPMREERSQFGLTALNGCLYAIGGYGNKKSAERFDPREGKWAPIADMHSGKSCIQATPIGGRIFAYGECVVDEGPVAELYDLIADRWEAAKGPPGKFVVSAMTWYPSEFNR